MKTTFNSRPVEYEIEFGVHSACDSFISKGWYCDGDMEDLTDSELEQLQDENADEICSADMENHGYYRD
jgi:hypothetical protein